VAWESDDKRNWLDSSQILPTIHCWYLRQLFPVCPPVCPIRNAILPTNSRHNNYLALYTLCSRLTSDRSSWI